MGTPATLPADFTGFDEDKAPATPSGQAPQTLPADFSGFDEDKHQSPAAPPEVQPYSMPNGRQIDPMTHTGGLPNPHATLPVAPPSRPQDIVQASAPQTWFDKARNYVRNSTPMENIHGAFPAVTDALGLSPTETAPAQAEREANAGIYKPVSAVKEIGAGLSNLEQSTGMNDQAIALMQANPGMTAAQAVAKTRQAQGGTNWSQAAKGGNQVMGGAMEVSKPLLPVAIAEAPVAAAIYYGTGILAGKGSAAVAQEMGATPDEVNFFNTLGFFIPGVLTGLAAVKSAGIPEGATVRDPVTGAEVPVRGGVVGGKGFAAGVARSDTGGYAGQVRVGPYSAKVRFGRNIPDEAPAGPTAPAGLPQGQVLPPEPQPSPVALQQQAQQATIEETAARAAAAARQAAQIAGLAPAPPPPPKPGEPGSKQAPLPPGMANGQLSQQVVENVGTAVQHLPPEVQPKAVLEATGHLAQWMQDRKTFVGPDGKVVNVDSPKAAQTEAVSLINNEVERQATKAEEAAKAQKEQQDAQQKALEQQQKDAETAAEEREQARQDAEKNEVKPLPDTPQMQKIRAELAKLPQGMKRADVEFAVRKAGAGARMLVPQKLASRLADEYLANSAQREDAAVAGITGEQSNPDQDPIALGKLAADVQQGKTAFLHVAPGTKFKPTELTKENGFISTAVKKAQDPTFNGVYFHPAGISSKDVKAAASGESPLAALHGLEASWKAGKTAQEPENQGRSVLSESLEQTQLGNSKPETKAPEPETKPAVAETGPKEPEPMDEVQLYREARQAALARGINPETTEEWGTAIAEEEARILAQRKGGEPEVAQSPADRPARTDQIGDQHKAEGKTEEAPAKIPQGVADFTAKMDPMIAKRVTDTLNSNRLFNGKLGRVGDEIERRVADGWTVQDSKTGRRFTGPDGRFLDEKSITKTGLNYADFLAKTKPVENEPDAPQVEQPEEKPAEVVQSSTANAQPQEKPVETPSPVVSDKPTATMSEDELRTELAGIEKHTHPLYQQLEKMGDAAFAPNSKTGAYTPDAQAISDRIRPYAKRAEFLRAELKEHERKAQNEKNWAATAKRIADAPVFQRRNGWEIVKDGGNYVLRDPNTKEEVYTGHLERARTVADESKPEAPASAVALKPGQKVTVRQLDGTQKPDEVRLVLPNKKVVLKGQRKPVKVEDVSPIQKEIEAHQATRQPGTFAQAVIDHGKLADRLAGLLKDPNADPKELAEVAAKVDVLAPDIERETGGSVPAYAEDMGYKKPVEAAPVKTDAEALAKEPETAGTAFYSNPLADPALYKKYIGEPLMKMAEPLRQDFAERSHIADVANNIHDTLQNLDRTNRATTLESKALVRSIQKAGFSLEDGKEVFRNLEDPDVPLNEKQVELRDNWIKPMNQQTRLQYVITELIKSGKFPLEDILAGNVPQEEIDKLVPGEENYQHRIPVERDTFVDKLLGDTLKRFRAPGGILSRIFPSAKRTIFKEIHGPDGEREVVSVKNGRVTQFINKDNEGILDQRLKDAQAKVAQAKQDSPTDIQRHAELQSKVDDLLQRKADLLKDGHTAIDMGAHLAGYVNTNQLADEAVRPLEQKLAGMKKEFSVLHGSQKRAIASQQRIENLYYDIDRTEKLIAAIRASVGPEQEAQQGLSRQEALQERIKPLEDQIERLTEKQADLAGRETNTQWGQRQLKSLPGRIQDLKDRIDAIGEEMAGQGLQGSYWRDRNGNVWKFNRGTTEFISSRSGQQYHADARLAGIVNYMETNKAMNAAVVLERAKGLLETEGMALKTDNRNDAPKDWKQTSLQQMRGYYFPAHVADAFDQFDYLQQRGAPNVFQMLNNFVIQTILMNPLYHGINIGSNWFAGKEGEALAGGVVKPSFYVDNVKAGIEAANMMKDWGGPEYQRLLRLGLDLRGADAGFDIRTKEILRSFTDQLDQDKPSNALMSSLLGVKNAAHFMRSMNHQITFGMGDLALAQSFYAKRAQLIRDGMPAEKAEEAARDWAHRLVGEYTTPIRLAGSAGLGRLAENPLAQSFFRYHFGYILRPLATAVRESLGEFKPDEEESKRQGETVNEFGQTPAASRTLAIARLAALVIMAAYVFPKILDKAAKKITNDERAQAPRGGLFKFATDAYETATGERSLGNLAHSVFTPGLGTEKAAEIGSNYDFFTGRHIVGSDQGPAGMAKQLGAWLLKGTLPGQTAARVDQSGLRQVVEGLAGFKFPIEHGIKEAVEIRRDEGGKNPPDPARTRIFQSIMAAAEQSHRTQGSDTSLYEELMESGKLSNAEKKTLHEAIKESPIVFATRGLEHPQDYYRVLQHSTDAEKSDLLRDGEFRHKLNVYQKELRSQGKTEQADAVYQELVK